MAERGLAGMGVTARELRAAAKRSAHRTGSREADAELGRTAARRSWARSRDRVPWGASSGRGCERDPCREKFWAPRERAELRPGARRKEDEGAGAEQQRRGQASTKDETGRSGHGKSGTAGERNRSLAGVLARIKLDREPMALWMRLLARGKDQRMSIRVI
jgi:hypothetical protein